MIFKYFKNKIKLLLFSEINPGCILGKNVIIQRGVIIDSETSIGKYIYVGQNSIITKTIIDNL
jgi:UDP-3-O-[3-hydroxymyristoyl] glucosamine N-acyltransferase